MNVRTENGNAGFLIGLVTGGIVGAGLAFALAPRVAKELARARAAVDDVSRVVSDGYRDTGARIAEVVDGVTAKGQAVRDDAADAVARGARQVEEFAMASKTSPRRS